MATMRAFLLLVLLAPPLITGCLPSDADIAGDMEAERRAAYLEWKQMRDRGESASAKVDGPLTLDDAIKLALQYNKSLQGSLQDRDVARGERIAAWSVVLPTVTVGGGANRAERTLDSYSSSLTVTQPIMQGASYPATIRERRLASALADEGIRAAIQTLMTNVATSYYDVLLAQHLLQTNREAVVSAEAQLRVVTEKRRQETATDYDVLRAQVDVATYRAQMLSQQNLIDTNRVALLKYMGVSQDSEVAFSDDLEFLPMRPVFERAVEIASGLRPDLREAELTARMRDEAIKIAQSGYWPRISAVFSRGWYNGSDNPRGGDDTWSAGASASWEFGVGAYGNTEAAKARARKSRIDILDREENMLSDIRRQMNSLANAEEVVKALQVNQEASREALRLVEIGYQAGVKTELDVQDARKALTDVQGQYWTALSDHTKARLNLQVAMGVLGPQRVNGSALPRGSSVPIAEIEEFADDDYQPLTGRDFLVPENAATERLSAGMPAARAGNRRPAADGDDFFAMGGDDAVADVIALPPSAERDARPTEAMVPVRSGEEPGGMAMPPPAPPLSAAPAPAESAPTPLFKVTVRNGG